MSCHNIGRGMNSVVRTAVTLMDEGKISREAARTIISSCRRAVNWCDGNAYEAVDYIERCVCGRCMKMVPKEEKLYAVYAVSPSGPRLYDLVKDMATDRLCEECFDAVLNEQCKDSAAGERERVYIETEYGPDYYMSTGEYETANNGLRWG